MKRIEQSGKFPIALVAIFLCFSAAIIIAGTMFGSYISKKIKLEAESDLSAIADLKMQQILLWQKNRLSEADLLSESPFYVNAAEELIANPGNRSLRMQMQERLDAQLKSQYWHDMLLLDNKGKIVMTGGSKITTVGDKTSELLDNARRQKQPLMSDFYFCDICQTVHMDIIVPLFKLSPDRRQKTGLIGYTIMRLDPNVFLYPLIQSWPSPSKSSETLLVKKDGQNVLFLNELRFKKDTSLKFRIPLKQRSLPASVAVAGSSGVFNGLDYRGVRVISHLRSIPGTDWHMVTKVDYDEVFSDLKRQEVLVFVIILALIGLTASLIIAVFFAQRREHYKNLLIAENDRQALIKHFDYLTKYANDMILLSDEDFRLIEVNEKAVQVYGYPRDEMLSMTAVELRADEEQASFKDQMVAMLANEGMIYETKHKRKDGSVFTAEVSTRPIEIEGKKYLQDIIRDISERKQYELDIQERNEELESANQELMASEEELKASDEELRHYIEELQQSKDELVQSRNFLDSVIDQSPNPMWISDDAGNLIRINQACCDLLKIKQEEVVGKYNVLKDNIVEEQGFIPKIKNVFDKGETVHFELIYDSSRLRTIDLEKTSAVILDVTIFSIKNMSGKVTNAVIQHINITERKRAEEALRETETRLVTLSDNLPNGMVYQIDSGKDGLQRKFAYISAGVEKLHGVTAEEVLKDASAIYGQVVEEDRNMLAELEGKALAQMSQFSAEVRIKMPSGAIRWSMFISSPRRLQNGDLVWDGLEVDITLRKQAEEALAKNRALLAESQEMAKIGGWEFDVETMAQTWTEETFRILEIDTTQGEPKVPEGVDFIAPEYRDMAKTAIQRAIEYGEPYDQEWEVKTAKGNRRWVRVIAKVNRENGKTKSVSGSFQNISERKQAEEKIKQQLSELQRWQSTMLDREDRVMELKKEINELLDKLGLPQKYISK